MKNLTIVNNTAVSLSLVHPHIIAFAETGETHEDIADLFNLVSVLAPSGKVKVVVTFKED